MSLERHAEDVSLEDRAATVAGPPRYLIAILGGMIAALAVFCAMYGTLYVSGYLPPPPLSNNVCADEKLVFFRDNPPTDPNFLVIGSSVAWRNINSAVIARGLRGARPVNGGFCGMQMNQSAFIANWMLTHWPEIERVLLVVSPLDFTACMGTGQVFDPADVNRFVFEHGAMWSFYLRYFDPVSLRRNIQRQINDREQARILKVDQSYTKYGDGPHDTTENRGLFYGQMAKPDPRCFTALRSLATKLAEQSRPFEVVVTPIHPGWKLEYDPDHRYLSGFEEQLATALVGTGARLWNADAAHVVDKSAFTDAVHIRWTGATRLTAAIVDRMNAN
jgi:hypothetical protein